MSALRLKGSTSGYVEITAPAVAADNSLVLPSSGELVARDSIGNIENIFSINKAPISGYRNRIINGDMRIDQRNNGATVTGNANYAVDRWRSAYSPVGKGAFSSARSNILIQTVEAAYDYQLKAQVTTATTDITGTDDYNIQQYIEGTNVVDFGFGTSNAQPVTISFYAYSSVAGTYTFALKNAAANRSYVATYSLGGSSFDYITITIPGDVTGTWGRDTGIGFECAWSLSAGPSLETTANTWVSGNYSSVAGATKWISTSNAVFYLTAVQVELGPTATSFARRSYGEELALCQRYFETGQSTLVAYYSGNSFGGGLVNYPYKATKRVIPTQTFIPGVGSGLITSFSTLPKVDSFSVWWDGNASLGDYREFTFKSSAEFF